VFNGSRFRAEIAPRISDFMLSNHRAPGSASAAVAEFKPRVKSGASGQPRSKLA